MVYLNQNYGFIKTTLMQILSAEIKELEKLERS